MQETNEPLTPLDAYKAIVDELVAETLRFGAATQVAEKGLFSKAPAHREYNDFIESLTPEQRDLLSQMLHEERDSTIHDVLALLSWWVDCRELGFTFGGDSMPVDLSGMGLHGDYVGRRDGWHWPEGEEDGA